MSSCIVFVWVGLSSLGVCGKTSADKSLPDQVKQQTRFFVRVSCSTYWASRARWIWCFGVCTITIALPSTSDRYNTWEKWLISLTKQELTRHLETRCLSLAAIDALSCSFFAIILHTSYAVTSLEEKLQSSFIRTHAREVKVWSRKITMAWSVFFV